MQPRLRFQFLQYIGAPQRSLILAHEVWRVLNRFSLFHAVASLFVRFRLGLLEWVFPGFSHTTIPKVQRNANLVDLEKCSKMSIWLQRLASMTSITSLSKFGGDFIHFIQSTPC